MKSFRAEDLYGIWATILLPINDDDEIDFARLAEEVSFLCGSGVDGIYVHGTSGEFHTLTESEFDAINILFAEQCEDAAVPFQIGASHMSAQISLERIRRAAALRPAAIQVILPDWIPPNDMEAITFLQQAAEAASGIGLVLYNPAHAKRRLEPESYRRFRSAVPQLIGIKTPIQNMDWYKLMREIVPEIAVFGPGPHLASAFQYGAVGSYSFVAALTPHGAKHWYNMIKQDIQHALELETTIQAFITTHIAPFKSQQGYVPPALDKLMAGIGGWGNIGLRIRSPYRSIPESEAKRLQPVARAMLPELFQHERNER